MPPSKRKQRFQSEPLPVTRDESASPQPETTGSNKSPASAATAATATTATTTTVRQRLQLDPLVKQSTSASAKTMSFPLTPTSAAGDRDQRVADVATQTTSGGAHHASGTRGAREEEEVSERASSRRRTGTGGTRSRTPPRSRLSRADAPTSSPRANIPHREHSASIDKNMVQPPANPSSSGHLAPTSSSPTSLKPLHTHPHHSFNDNDTDPATGPSVRNPPVNTNVNGSSSSLLQDSASRNMSYRVENIPIRPRPFHDTNTHPYAHPSPPPITTLTSSPSLSSDRSSLSSPAPTVLPPLSHQLPSHSHPSHSHSQPQLHSYLHPAPQQQYRHSTIPQPSAYHYYQSTVSPPDVFATPVPAYTHSYSSGYAPPPPTHLPVHNVDIALSSQHYGAPYGSGGSMHSYSSHTGGGSGGFTPIYTDDAATKLSDRVRRRCFNCCTTDTSTWRRSSLNPGKVLCNKCGLFERTHSRPRPDQFPHRRGPLAPGFPSRSPTSMGDGPGSGGSIMTAGAPHVPAHMSQHSLPPTNPHPSLATSYNSPGQLPQIQEWLRNPGPPATGSALPSSGAGSGVAPSNISILSAGPGLGAGAGASSSTSAASSPSGQSRGASVSSVGDRHVQYGSSSASQVQNGQGGQRSPPNVDRLLKRSDSGHSDFHTSPLRGARNLSVSPSPPPDGPSSRVTGGSSSGSDAGHA